MAISRTDKCKEGLDSGTNAKINPNAKIVADAHTPLPISNITSDEHTAAHAHTQTHTNTKTNTTIRRLVLMLVMLLIRKLLLILRLVLLNVLCMV